MSMQTTDFARRLDRVRRAERDTYARGFYHGAFGVLVVLIVLLAFVTVGGQP